MTIAPQFTQHLADLILQRIPECTPDAILILESDSPYTILYSNPSVFSIFNWTPEELVGKPLEVLLPPDIRAGHGVLVERFKGTTQIGDSGRAMTGGQRRIQGWSRNNTVVPLSISIGVIDLPSPGVQEEGVFFASEAISQWKDSRGELPDVLPSSGRYLYAIIRNARDLIEKESTINKEQARSRLISLATNISTIDWELKEGSLEISDNWLNMTGYSLGDLPTKLSKGIPLEQILPQLIDAWGEYIHPDDRQRAKQELMNYLVLRKDPVYDNIYRFLCKDGKYIDLWSRGSGEWDSEGRLVRFITCHTDIAELKEESRQLNEQKSAIQSKLLQTETELKQIREQQDSAIARLDKMAGFVDRSKVLIGGVAGLVTVVASIVSSFGGAAVGSISWTVTRILSPPKVEVLSQGAVTTPEWKPIIDALASRQVKDELSNAIRYGDRVVVGIYVPVPKDSDQVAGYGIIAAQAYRQGVDSIPMKLWKIDDSTLRERAKTHFSNGSFEVNSTTNTTADYVLYQANSQISHPGKVKFNGKSVTFYVGLECIKSECENRTEIIKVTREIRNTVAMAISKQL